MLARKLHGFRLLLAEVSLFHNDTRVLGYGGKCVHAQIETGNLAMFDQVRTAIVSVATASAILVGVTASASASVLFSNGFETDISGWFTPTRVASGAGGITSATGSFHATTAEDAGDFTRWGGYGFGAGPAAFQAYKTSIDIYLDVGANLSNDTRFDFSSAISTPANAHRRDFVFNVGFYSDTDGSPGSGTNRFIISASNNAGRSNSFPKNPGRDPFAIDTTGWYTFMHTFYDGGAGQLAVDLTIMDASATLLHTWTLTDATDIIGSTVGGNRYGWFVNNELSVLAFDNTFLETTMVMVPEPATLALFGLGLAGLGFARRRRVA